jgi:hypothetical protein
MQPDPVATPGGDGQRAPSPSQIAGDKAGMILDEKTVGFWILQVTPTGDWLATIREITPDEKYETVYRFRYYEDDEAFDSKDKKNWYSGTIKGTRNFVLAGFRAAAANLASVAVGPLTELLNDKGPEDLQRRLLDAPGIYARMERLDAVSEDTPRTD